MENHKEPATKSFRVPDKRDKTGKKFYIITVTVESWDPSKKLVEYTR